MGLQTQRTCVFQVIASRYILKGPEVMADLGGAVQGLQGDAVVVREALHIGACAGGRRGRHGEHVQLAMVAARLAERHVALKRKQLAPLTHEPPLTRKPFWTLETAWIQMGDC